MEQIDLKAEVNKLFKEYNSEVEDAVEDAVKTVAKNAVKKLKAKKSFAANSRATGEYASGLKSKVEKRRLEVSATVYNAKLPSRVHLLENGHATRNGNGREYPRTPAYPHVAPVAEETEKELLEEIEKKVRG